VIQLYNYKICKRWGNQEEIQRIIWRPGTWWWIFPCLLWWFTASKIWLYTPEDFGAMYNKFQKGRTITLWCDGNYSNKVVQKRKGECCWTVILSSPEEESEILLILQSYKISIPLSMTPALRLWLRMISAGIHHDPQVYQHFLVQRKQKGNIIWLL